MYFHCAILIHFRPFINLTIIGSSIAPRSVCLEASKNISSLVKAYKHLYGLRRVPVFLPYILMTAELAMIALDGEASEQSTPDTDASDNTGYLAELSPWYPFAERALAICEFFRQRRISKVQDLLQHQDADMRENKDNDDDSNEDDDSRGLTVLGSHVQTFFPTSDQDRTFAKRASRPASSLHKELAVSSLGTLNFPLQTNPLEKIIPGPTPGTDDAGDVDSNLREVLRAHGLMLAVTNT